MFAIIGSVGHPKANVATEIIGTMEAQNKDYNMNVVRSVWRFVKLGPKKHRVRLEDELAFQQRRTQKL